MGKNSISHFQIFTDSAGWASDQSANEMNYIYTSLGLTHAKSAITTLTHHSILHFVSPDIAIRNKSIIRLGKGPKVIDFFHGLPADDVKFNRRWAKFRQLLGSIDTIRVTHDETGDFLTSNGFPNVVKISIPVDLDVFTANTVSIREQSRNELGIPKDIKLIGSFQKDGQGWGTGTEPKMEKGPDIFVETVSRIKTEFPVHVLLTGPARGYVSTALTEAGVPFTDLGNVTRLELKRAYSALDLYLVSSRAEGGPRALLESLVSGIPVVTTNVGQVNEIRGFPEGALKIVDSFEPSDLAAASVNALTKFHKLVPLTGTRTAAEKYSIRKSVDQWEKVVYLSD